jgi:hypothetical protein
MDIKYEKDGVQKMAGERFKEALEAVGWKVVEEKKAAEEKKEIKRKLSLKDE